MYMLAMECLSMSGHSASYVNDSHRTKKQALPNQIACREEWSEE